MSEARAITNTIGNAVGTLAIGRWVGAVDRKRLSETLDGKTDPEDLHALYEGDVTPNIGLNSDRLASPAKLAA
jgi:aerobic C4-dicarboxylate transport protein